MICVRRDVTLWLHCYDKGTQIRGISGNSTAKRVEKVPNPDTLFNKAL